MSELKTNEKMALIRAEAVAELDALANAAKVDTGTYIMKVENGYAKVTVTAIKDADYDVEGAVAEYEDKLAERAMKAEEKMVARAAKAAEKEAKKAAKEKAE